MPEKEERNIDELKQFFFSIVKRLPLSLVHIEFRTINWKSSVVSSE